MDEKYIIICTDNEGKKYVQSVNLEWCPEEDSVKPKIYDFHNARKFCNEANVGIYTFIKQLKYSYREI